MATQLPAVHPRHLNVGQDEVNRRGMLFYRGDRFAAMAGRKRLIACPGQHATRKMANSLLIVDYQNRIAAGWALGRDRAGSRRALLRHDLSNAEAKGERATPSMAFSLSAASSAGRLPARPDCPTCGRGNTLKRYLCLPATVV